MAEPSLITRYLAELSAQAAARRSSRNWRTASIRPSAITSARAWTPPCRSRGGNAPSSASRRVIDLAAFTRTSPARRARPQVLLATGRPSSPFTFAGQQS